MQSLALLLTAKKKITDEQAHNKLSIMEDILYNLTIPQLTINDEIDEIVRRSPSAEDAKRLVEMRFRVAAESTVLKKLPEDWLPYMTDAGFFKDPSPIFFTRGQPKYGELDTITISHKMCKCISRKSHGYNSVMCF